MHCKHIFYHFPFISLKKGEGGLFLEDKGQLQAFHRCLHSSLLNHHGGKRGKEKKNVANTLLTAILPCLLCAIRKTASGSPWQLRPRVTMGASTLRCWWTHTGLSWAEGSEAVASQTKIEEDSSLTLSQVFFVFLLHSMPYFPWLIFLSVCLHFLWDHVNFLKSIQELDLSYIPQN